MERGKRLLSGKSGIANTFHFRELGRYVKLNIVLCEMRIHELTRVVTNGSKHWDNSLKKSINEECLRLWTSRSDFFPPVQQYINSSVTFFFFFLFLFSSGIDLNDYEQSIKMFSIKINFNQFSFERSKMVSWHSRGQKKVFPIETCELLRTIPYVYSFTCLLNFLSSIIVFLLCFIYMKPHWRH